MRWTDFLRMVDPPFLRMIIPVHKMGRNHRIKSFNFRQTYNIKWIQVAEIYPMKYPQLSHSVRCRNRHAWGLKNHSSKVPWTPQLEPILAGPGKAMIIPLKVTASTNRKKIWENVKMWFGDVTVTWPTRTLERLEGFFTTPWRNSDQRIMGISRNKGLRKSNLGSHGITWLEMSQKQQLELPWYYKSDEKISSKTSSSHPMWHLFSMFYPYP